jgi:hypothetical protein
MHIKWWWISSLAGDSKAGDSKAGDNFNNRDKNKKKVKHKPASSS